MAKILLVEANEMPCGMLARLLEWRGYQVVIAIDGAPGARLAQADLRHWESRGIELKVPCLALDVMLSQEHREGQL
jgi:DNA-binding response OmpR family regulator